MEGFLNKQGEKGLVLNLWRKRWFQLDPHTQRMYYYKSKSKEELLGYINLAEASDVRASEPKDAFSFVIQTRDRVWQLSASSEVDKQAWITAIDKVIRRTAASIRPSAVEAIAVSGSPASLRKSSEYLGIFEFEGEDAESQLSAPDTPEDANEHDSKGFTFDMENSEDADDAEFPAPPAPTPLANPTFLCGSLPVNVPRMASSWQTNPTWSYHDVAGHEDDAGFVQPHEMAARTYKEITLQTGIDFTGRPRSSSKRMEAFM